MEKQKCNLNYINIKHGKKVYRNYKKRYCYEILNRLSPVGDAEGILMMKSVLASSEK